MNSLQDKTAFALMYYFENAPSITPLDVTNLWQQEILIRECDVPR